MTRHMQGYDALLTAERIDSWNMLTNIDLARHNKHKESSDYSDSCQRYMFSFVLADIKFNLLQLINLGKP